MADRDRGPRAGIAAAAACLVVASVLAATAGADHSVSAHVSVGQVNGNGAFDADFAGASDDGSRVFFETDEQLVGADNDASQDVYQHFNGMTTRVSAGLNSDNGAFDADFEGVSADGSSVFLTTDEQLAAADTDNDQDVYVRSGNQTTRISRGETACEPVCGNGPNFAAFVGASADGSRAFFQTDEQLVAATDTDTSTDIYERSGGQTTQVTVGAVNGNDPIVPSFRSASADGTRVFFLTDEQLVAADTDAEADVYQRFGGQTTRITRGEAACEPACGNGATFDAFDRGISTDGSTVFFVTSEQLVADDADAVLDLYQRSGGQTTRLSVGGAACVPACGNGTPISAWSGASADGTRAFFRTPESLVPADTDAEEDIYERSGGQTTLVSAGGNGLFDAFFWAASADGTRVFFTTAEQLVATDTDSVDDVYMGSGGQTTRVSFGPNGGNGPNLVFFRGISADGARVFFDSSEQLVAGDTDTTFDVYERSGNQTTLLSTGQINGNGNVTAGFEGASTDGTLVLFDTEEQLASSDSDSEEDIYSVAVAPPTPPVDPPPDTGGEVADATPPDTTITGGPKKKEKRGKASFSFTSSEAASTFECSLDDGPFEACTSPEDVKVKKGKHTFSVRARDAAGNVDGSPATQDWKFKKKKKKK